MSDLLTIVRCIVKLFIGYSLRVPNARKLASVSCEVARILKAEREKRRLSMTSLAAKAGLSQQMVSYVERGLRNPTLETLLRITTALGVDLAKIIATALRVR